MLLSIFALLSSLLLYGFHSPALTFFLAHRSGLTATALYHGAALLDRDGDGNSLWPGGDPDDSDPCAFRTIFPERYSLPSSCLSVDKAPDKIPDKIPSIPDKVLDKIPDIPDKISDKILYKAPENNLFLLTLTGDLPLLGAIPLWPHRYRLWAPSDQTAPLLRAFFENLNGVEEQLGLQERSFIVQFSRIGMRTICGGSDSAFFSADSPYDLDKGCQILPTFPAGDLSKRDRSNVSKNFPEQRLEEFVSQFLKVFYKYRERKNFLWLHYSFNRDASHSTILSAILSVGPLLKALGKKSNSALLYLPTGRLYADFYISPLSKSSLLSQNPSFYDTMLWLAGALKKPPGQGRQMPGVIHYRPLSFLIAKNWKEFFYRDRQRGIRNYPLYSYRPAAKFSGNPVHHSAGNNFRNNFRNSFRNDSKNNAKTSATSPVANDLLFFDALSGAVIKIAIEGME